MSIERATLTAESRALMVGDPESARYITLDMDNREEFALAIKEGLRARSRTAIRIYAEMCKFVGTQVQQINALFVDLGVRDKSEIARALDLMRSGQHITAEEFRESCVTGLRMLFAEHPEWRASVLASLSSGAEVIEHKNGDAK